MRNRIFTVFLAAALLLSCLTLPAAAAKDVATIGTTGYTSLQAAVDAYTDATEPIRLLADIGEAVTVSKDIYLDLNGCDVTGKVTVTAGTLYGMDSQTDDYTVADDAGYGKLTNVSGKVAGVPVEAAGAEDGYLMVKEENALSFHRVNLQIYGMTLRPEDASVYFKSHFAGDELVADRVERYGIALSVEAIPTQRNLETACKYTAFTAFQAGSNGQNSTLLKDILEKDETVQTNNANSQMPVYGRAYLLTKEGQYLFGNAVCRSLAEQVQLAASDDYWKQLDKTQKDSTVSMYRNYKDVMRHWGLRNIESRISLNGDDPLAPASKSLKVLAITSSFGLNTTQLLYDVAVAEGYAPENVTVARLYASGCSLEKHVTNAPDKPVYQYTKVSGDPAIVAEHAAEGQVVGKMFEVKKEGYATLLDGLLDEKWDIIFMQQGARISPIASSYTDSQGRDYITRLRGIMEPYVQQQCPDARFVWNMLWAFDKGSAEKPLSSTFKGDQNAMYQASIDCTMTYVIPRTDYDRIIPSGTAIQNARTSFFGETLSRDTYHLNNLGAAIAAYDLFAVLTGKEITQVNLDIVSASSKNGIAGAAKIKTPLREDEKLVIMESVNNALRNPYAVTPSQYPPEDYSGYNYTDNLKFLGDTKVAVCPACKAKATWTEINQNNLNTLTDYIGTSSSMPSGSYHFYLSSDVTYSGDNTVFYLGGNGRNLCLHLNGNDLTATKNGIAIVAGNAKLNIMGTGTVIGNHEHSHKYRGSAITLNAGTTTDPGTVRLYSGTYIQPEGNAQYAPVCTSWQGGLLEIFADATLTGKTNGYSLYLNTTNGDASKKYNETVNIYGGTFNRPVYAKASSSAQTPATVLNVSGGTFNHGIEVISNTDYKQTGSPVIKGE